MILLQRCDFCGDLAVTYEETPLGNYIYGDGLGAIVVSEREAGKPGEVSPLDSLPTVPLGGVTWLELVTALGSAVAFEKAGVSYTVGGSLTAAAAESAARALAS